MSVSTLRSEITAHASPLRHQVLRAGLAAAVGAVVVLAFLALSLVADEQFKYFSKEPAESLGARPYIGWLANLTSMTWMASGGTALLAGAVLLRSGRRSAGHFLLAFGVFTTVLTIDDLFLVHEVANNNGLPEELIYLVYGVTTLSLMLRFAREISRNDGLLLLLAVSLWAASVGFDFLQENFGFTQYVLEDGAKVVGVIVWAFWLVAAGARELLAATAGAAGSLSADAT